MWGSGFVSGFLTDADLELNKQEVVTDIMSRPEFSNITTRFPTPVRGHDDSDGGRNFTVASEMVVTA